MAGNDMLPASGWPYIIVAPDYKESSAGIQALHRLCHLLNEAGQQAWMKSSEVHPEWNTPVVPFEDLLQYCEGDKPFIAVYPEVEHGNPLNARVVVRYMLNRERAMADNGMDARAEDLIFWYRDEFAGKQFNPNILGIEAYDLSTFCDDQREKDLDLLYLNRVPEKCVDFRMLPEGITVLSMKNPLTLNELASVLKRGRVLYSFESSGTCLLANLCGCPVVALSTAGYENLAANTDTERDNHGGFAWSDEPEELERARLTLSDVRMMVQQKRVTLQQQLASFISITQQRAEEQKAYLSPPDTQSWLVQRKFSAAQQQQMSEKIANLNRPATLLVVIRNVLQDEKNLHLTLNSLAECRAHYPYIRAELTHAPQVPVTLPAWVTIARDTEVVQRAEEDWVQFVEAGCRYLIDGLCTTGVSLCDVSACFAVFADELTETAEGELETALRPDFNLDLLLSVPWRYARRWLFRREALAGLNCELSCDTPGYELEVITRLIEQQDISGIGHINEVLLVIPPFQLQPVEIEAAVIQRHIQQRGYPQGKVSIDGKHPWRLSYGDTSPCTVSIMIPAGSHLHNLQRCVDLILRKTTHENYEIIIVNHQQTDAMVNDWLQSIISKNLVKLQVVTSALNEGLAALINRAIAAAGGDFIVLLSANMVVVQNNWLSNLLNHALRPEVGAVSGKIITLDQHVLSAGEIIAGEAFSLPVGYGATTSDDGYMQRLQSDQNYTLLNADYLLLKKDAWHDAGGMAKDLISMKQLGVDICLTLRQRGYMSVWTPYSVIATDVYHASLRCREITAAESQANDLLRQRWLPLLVRDPAYNDNFSSLRRLFKPEWRSVLTMPQLLPHSTPSLLGITSPASAGAADYSMSTIRTLNRREAVNGLLTEHAFDYRLINRADADGVVISGDLPAVAIERIAALKKRASSVVSLMLSCEWMIRQTGTENYSFIDRLIVQNSAQAEAVRQYDRPVVILPRSLLPFAAVAKPDRRAGDKLRVLCNTCELTDADIELVQNLVRELASEVSWQVLGPLPAGWEPWIEEHYRYPGQEYYLPLLASIDTDLAIVPRADNKLSRLKDDFILVELAACVIPALVSDMSSLQSHIPALRVRNRKVDWLEAIRKAAGERAELVTLAHRAQHALRDTDWLADETVNQHLRAWLP